MDSAPNPFRNALLQLDRANAVQALDPKLIDRLRVPEREVQVYIPVDMDDGSQKIFHGYRVQYSSLLGPYKGGIRYHEATDESEVKALAFWMTIKTALAGVAMGGGKGGITVNPKTLSKGELERLSRGWARLMAPVIGPSLDVPAPDVNTTPEIMGWMVDEYEKLTGDRTRAAFTGKAVGEGGSEGRGAATGLGGFYVFDALRENLGIAEGASVAIQGIGNVGGHAAEIFKQHGYRIIALSDSKGAIVNDDGLDPVAVEAYKKEHGTLAGYPGARVTANDELLLLPVDILIPAALENQITKDNAREVKAKVVLELANGPVTPEADDILHGRGIHTVPDILANAGGVIVSTFEWQQNLAGEHWSEEEVFTKLRDMLTDASTKVWQRSSELSTDLRRAAFVLALERLAGATH